LGRDINDPDGDFNHNEILDRAYNSHSDLQIYYIKKIQAALKTHLARRKCDDLKFGTYKFKSFTNSEDSLKKLQKHDKEIRTNIVDNVIK